MWKDCEEFEWIKRQLDQDSLAHADPFIRGPKLCTELCFKCSGLKDMYMFRVPELDRFVGWVKCTICGFSYLLNGGRLSELGE